MDTLILNCYRLAKFYGVDPQVFLDKPASQIDRDCYWTDEIGKGDAIEEAWQEKLRNG